MCFMLSYWFWEMDFHFHFISSQNKIAATCLQTLANPVIYVQCPDNTFPSITRGQDGDCLVVVKYFER